MPDNVPITPAASGGAVIATDQVTRNSVLEHQQIMKIALGPDGVYQGLLEYGQKAASGSISVVFASDIGSITINHASVLSIAPITGVTNAIFVIKNAAGFFHGGYVYNPNTVAAYLHVYNEATPTQGSSVPVAIYAIPPGSGAVLELAPGGVSFGNAIKCAATTTPGGSTALATAIYPTFNYR